MSKLIKIRVQESVIKGYHHFQIKPPKDVYMKIDLEYSNIQDENAALVWIPPLNELPAQLHDVTSDAERFLKVSDIAGLPVGHVPRGLAGCFRAIIEDGGSITAIATGEACQSFPPWPAPQEIGGGAVIPCDYIIETENQEHVMMLEHALDSMPEKEAMTLSVQ